MTLTPLGKAMQHEERGEYRLAADEYQKAGDGAAGHTHAEQMYAKAEECRMKAKVTK